MFQSLFYWNLLSYLLYRSKASYFEQFQSLFYWNLLSYYQVEHLFEKNELVSILVLLEPPLILHFLPPAIWYVPVSILVLLEPPLIRAALGVSDLFSSKFQSLFYWNLLSYAIGISQVYAQEKFQSLFYWNLLSYLMLLFPFTITLPRVSILVLLEPPLIQWKKKKYCLRLQSFNPCFTGTSSHT